MLSFLRVSCMNTHPHPPPPSPLNCEHWIRNKTKSMLGSGLIFNLKGLKWQGMLVQHFLPPFGCHYSFGRFEIKTSEKCAVWRHRMSAAARVDASKKVSDDGLPHFSSLHCGQDTMYLGWWPPGSCGNHKAGHTVHSTGEQCKLKIEMQLFTNNGCSALN